MEITITPVEQVAPESLAIDGFGIKPKSHSTCGANAIIVPSVLSVRILPGPHEYRDNADIAVE